MSILEVECLSNYYEIYAGSQWLYNCLSVHSLIAGKEKTPLGVPLPTVEPTNQCCGGGGGGNHPGTKYIPQSHLRDRSLIRWGGGYKMGKFEDIYV